MLRLAAEDAALQIVAAVVRKPPAQRVIDGVPHFAASELSGAPAFDVAIDFSLPEGFDPVLALCVARGVAFVSGTTGISAEQQATLDAASANIPLVWATNFSLGVAVLAELVERAAASLPAASNSTAVICSRTASMTWPALPITACRFPFQAMWTRWSSSRRPVRP